MKKIVICSVVAAGIAGAIAAALLIKNETIGCKSCRELGKHDIGVHDDDDLKECSTKDYFDECFPDAE